MVWDLSSGGMELRSLGMRVGGQFPGEHRFGLGYDSRTEVMGSRHSFLLQHQALLPSATSMPCPPSWTALSHTEALSSSPGNPHFPLIATPTFSLSTP